MAVIPDVAFFELPPDWVCEVFSPRREEIDRVRKMPVYAREGLGHLWLVDAVERTLEVYGLEGGRWVVLGTHAGDERVRAAPFAAVELDLARWWIP
jgi:Uma2 family endonuclease